MIHRAPGVGPARTMRALNRVSTYIERQAALPEFVSMRRMSEDLERASLAEWTERSNSSIARLMAAAPATLTTAFLESVPGRLISSFGSWPSDDLNGLMADVIEETYRLSAQVILRKHEGVKAYQRPLLFKATAIADIIPTFNTRDEEAMAYLVDSQTFWMAEHFDTDVQNDIRGAGWVELAGQSGKQAGDNLRKTAERQFGVGAFATFGKAYFEGVAVNASTTARVTGALFEMRNLEIPQYQIVAVMDERTTEICQNMDGKKFPVSDATARIDDIIATDDPDGVRDLHEWRSNTFKSDLASVGVNIQIGQPVSEAGARTMIGEGFGFPPFHFRCRTTIDVV